MSEPATLERSLRIAERVAAIAGMELEAPNFGYLYVAFDDRGECYWGGNSPAVAARQLIGGTPCDAPLISDRLGADRELRGALHDRAIQGYWIVAATPAARTSIVEISALSLNQRRRGEGLMRDMWNHAKSMAREAEERPATTLGFKP